ncbi:MAG: LytR C-terminal domain-containing protein [Candidatus Cloacimonetes bacterium]|nr:LytR C-terminal domain-containing protein [Candidatus Cloacimonadota bacterium]
MKNSLYRVIRSTDHFLYRYGVLLFFIGIMLIACKEQDSDFRDLSPAIRVRVLNGCGYRNAASDFGNYLIRYNIDVIGVGNVDKFIYDKSIIVVKHDDPQDLKRLMKYTGITRRVFALDDHAVESFQIIAGRDFREYMRN